MAQEKESFTYKRGVLYASLFISALIGLGFSISIASAAFPSEEASVTTNTQPPTLNNEPVYDPFNPNVTVTPTPTFTGTPFTATPSRTRTPTHTPCDPECTATPSRTRTVTYTPTITGTRPTNTRTFTDTPTVTRTPTPPCSVTTYMAAGLPAPIPDGGLYTSFITVPDSIIIGHIEVINIGISHPIAEDNNFNLISPWGHTYQLFSGVCGRRPWTFETTGFTLLENTPNHIGSGCPPYADSYTPIGSLGARNFNAQGVWRLEVRDRFAQGATGVLGSWGLRVRSLICVTVTPQVQFTPTNTPTITLTPTVTNTPTPCALTYDQASTDVPKTINDLSTVTSVLQIAGGETITSVDVTGMNISHTNASDLSVFLISPLGTRVMLYDNECAGSEWTALNTGFSLSDDAIQTIGEVCPPLSYTYRPESPLAALAGQSVGGTWTLEITDGTAGNTGTLNGWGLRIATDVIIPCPTDTPTLTPTETLTRTPTVTRTETLTRTPSVTRTQTITATPGGPTHTFTRTPAVTRTFTGLPTITETPGGPTRTITPTRAPSRTPTPTRTPCDGCTPTMTPCPINFSDVTTEDWFYTFVQCLYCRGAISGYSNGTFRPYNNATRGQVCKIVALGFNIDIFEPPPTPVPSFSDVPVDNAFFLYVETAVQLGIVSGYSDGTFHPGNNVTRAQLCKIVVGAATSTLGWQLVNPPTPTFTDVAPGSAFYTYIETAVAHGIINGYEDGTFKPGNNASRAHISKIVCLAVSNGLRR